MVLPPYSPDIALSDYYLFSHLPHHQGEKKIGTDSDVEMELISYFSSRSVPFWKDMIRRLAGRWQQVVDADGEYIK
ncbi:unnamed protein product [Caenorhabditis auriculariae]|uniref:Tc1-like transposase DDE domain-containing protein n=1 Tax=Caenorhabditis auriculariae TaxID=2777116 RepID=A0A8S1HKW5_9PELO|nr:unnamed protein product [Caenorhabditis auriculariae]